MMARTGRDAAALVHPPPADLQGNSGDKREHKATKREEILVPAREIGYSSRAFRPGELAPAWARSIKSGSLSAGFRAATVIRRIF
jgi:hypothetical protein